MSSLESERRTKGTENLQNVMLVSETTLYVRMDLLAAFKHTAANIHIVDDPKLSLRFLGEMAELEYVCMTPLPKIHLSKQKSVLFMVGSIHFSVQQSTLLSRRSFSNGVFWGLQC